MFKTPPTSSQRAFPVLPDSTDDSPRPKSASNNNNSIQPLNTFPTPKTPLESSCYRSCSPVAVPSINPASPSPCTTPLSFINTSRDNQPFSSPITSPLSPRVLTVDYSSASASASSTPRTSSVYSISHDDYLKYLPSLSRYSEDEMISVVEYSIIDAHAVGLKAQKVIGQGSFSTVVSCKANNDEATAFAVKVPKNKKSCKPLFKELMNYKILQDKLQNDHIINPPILSVHGLTFFDKSQYSKIRYGESLPCLISEQLHSNLEELIKSKYQPNTSSLHIGSELWWKLARQLNTALYLLQSCSIIHLDLKPQNILFDNTTRDFKIADFTSASLTTDIQSEYQSRLNNGTWFDLTLQYCAPELVQSPPSPPSFSTDLYASGLILLNAATGKEPYSTALQAVGAQGRVIYLNECIKKNKVMDILSPEELNILESNRPEYELLKLILVERAPLNQIIEFVSRHCF